MSECAREQACTWEGEKVKYARSPTDWKRSGLCAPYQSLVPLSWITDQNKTTSQVSAWLPLFQFLPAIWEQEGEVAKEKGFLQPFEALSSERGRIFLDICAMFMWGITRYLCFAYDAWLIKFHRGRDFVIYFDSERNYTSTQNWFAPSRQSLQICVNAWVARWWAEHHFVQFAFLISWTLYICQINYIYVCTYDWYLSLTQPVERFQ